MNKTREEILSELNEVFCDIFDDEALKITEQTKADDIDDWDSLMHIRLVLAIEKHFGMKFSTAEVTSWPNVASVIDTISKHLS